jgi:hypothetical protein
VAPGVTPSSTAASPPNDGATAGRVNAATPIGVGDGNKVGAAVERGRGGGGGGDGGGGDAGGGEGGDDNGHGGWGGDNYGDGGKRGGGWLYPLFFLLGVAHGGVGYWFYKQEQDGAAVVVKLPGAYVAPEVEVGRPSV